MRGSDRQTGQLFSYPSPDSLVPADHPLRAIRVLVNAALERLSPRFAAIYAAGGRASIAPEKLLRALLLQALFSIRSERQLMEQLRYNMLFRWFVGLAMDVAVWDVTVFTKNRERLLEGDIAREFLAAILADPEVRPLLSAEHFSVDGTLIEAWASIKSFRPTDGGGEPPAPSGQKLGRNGERDFHGEKRSNATHASTTDPDARLFRKSSGRAAVLCHMGHALIENRNGLVVDTRLTTACGTAEREAAEAMIGDLPPSGRITLGADKAYDSADFVAAMRQLGVTAHVARNTSRRRSAIDGRTTRHAGYAVSQRIRKRVEEVFGWMKTTGGLRKTRHRGTARVDWMFTLTAAAYNLVRIPKLTATTA
ncbi:MAG: IS5 family transposase [Acetobacteraceae bacterium]